MISSRSLAAVVTALLALGTSIAEAQLYKCTSNDSVTYQNIPCPPNEARTQPTVEQLNAERKKKLASIRETSASSTVITTEAKAPLNVTTDTEKSHILENEKGKQDSRRRTQSDVRFSCDGRKHCSQMTSCAEATYFLSHCAGVKMDGDKNGIPCEQQWCSR